MLGLPLEVAVRVVLDRRLESVVRVDRRSAGDRECKPHAGELRRINETFDKGAVGRDVFVERHIGNPVPGEKCAVQYYGRRESGHLPVVPHADLDFAISDLDYPGTAGQSQRGQAERGEQVERSPPEPARRAGNQYPVVTERLGRKCACACTQPSCAPARLLRVRVPAVVSRRRCA